MKTKLKQLQTTGFCVALVALNAVLALVARASTFSDANWVSMGGIRGANGPVNACAVDDSGNLYIGGSFTMVGDVFATNIAKWNGTSWSPLGSGISGWQPSFGAAQVKALAVSGSNLYVGGYFTTAGGITASNIAKWNGSSWSPLGSGVNSFVFALALSGSDLYAGGAFGMAGGVPAQGIARWNGSSWSPLGSGMNPANVNALAILGSDLYAGGYFERAGGNLVNYIAKWNGISWSPVGSGMNNGVEALKVSGTDLYAGGAFTRATNSGGVSVTVNGVAKWNGIVWSALGSGVSDAPPGFASGVFELAVSGTNLYAGGSFRNAGGAPANYIAKWDGSSWSPLDSGISGAVFALGVSGSNLFAGGDYIWAGGSAAICIAKWNGSVWSALGSGIGSAEGYSSVEPSVNSLAASGADLYVGGAFTAAGGITASNIAKWNGNTWSPLGSGVSGGYPHVFALAASGSEVYAGGGFTTAGGIPANLVAKWDGSSWSALGSGMNDWVWSLAVSGSNLYAGGLFTGPANHIAKWDGSSWSALGSGVGDPPPGYTPNVHALAVSGGDLYAGGNFTTAGGMPVNYIAKWDGSSWSALGSGMNGWVTELAVSGSDLYAGGSFTMAGRIPANYIAKWNGSGWSALGSGVAGTVGALTVSGSDVYVGFTTVGGVPTNAVAKWNGSSWSVLGSGMNPSYSYVQALAASGSDLYAGGTFTIAGGKVSAYLARAVLGDAPGYNHLTGTLLSDGAMQLSYIGYPSTTYALDRTFNLTSPISWVGQETNTMTVSGVLTFTNAPAPATNNFWRVRSVP